jgi:hypothetical protein
METYETFIRSARNFREFANARKITQETGLTFAEARERCAEYNNNRTKRQIARGTKMEFTAE